MELVDRSNKNSVGNNTTNVTITNNSVSRSIRTNNSNASKTGSGSDGKRSAAVVINCTGLGAAKLTDVMDETMTPRRGVLVYLKSSAGKLKVWCSQSVVQLEVWCSQSMVQLECGDGATTAFFFFCLLILRCLQHMYTALPLKCNLSAVTRKKVRPT